MFTEVDGHRGAAALSKNSEGVDVREHFDGTLRTLKGPGVLFVENVAPPGPLQDQRTFRLRVTELNGESRSRKKRFLSTSF
jgi:hypothetical protein